MTIGVITNCSRFFALFLLARLQSIRTPLLLFFGKNNNRPISIAYNVPEISGSADTAGTVKSSSTGNLNLTRENVVGIFNGSIQWWNDTLLTTDNPRLADVPQRIIVTVRQDGSGTTSIFTRALAAFSKKWMYNRFLSFDQGNIFFKLTTAMFWNSDIRLDLNNLQQFTDNNTCNMTFINVRKSLIIGTSAIIETFQG